MLLAFDELLNLVINNPAAEKALSDSIDVGGIDIRALYIMFKFGVLSPVASNTLNSFPMCLILFSSTPRFVNLFIFFQFCINLLYCSFKSLLFPISPWSINPPGFSIEGPSQARIECNDNGDGSADVRYFPTAVGEYALHILCNNEDIPSSPYIAQILPKTDYYPEKVRIDWMKITLYYESTGSPRVKAFRLKANSYLRRQQLADFRQKNIDFHWKNDTRMAF